MTRDPEEAARWMLEHSDPRDVRSRICACDSLDQLRPWAAAYNDLREVLPPEKVAIIETIDRQVEKHKDRDATTDTPIQAET